MEKEMLVTRCEDVDRMKLA